MKIHFYHFLMATAVCTLMSCSSQTPEKPLMTETSVNLQKYAGHWYEVFRLPNSFQRDDSTAEAHYTVLSGGKVRVVNTETRPGGSQKVAQGEATAVVDSQNSRLKVKFEGLAALAPVPEEGNYWIIKVAPDYSTALVGTPDRKFLWLLSRTAKISEATRTVYLNEARRQGFDTNRLIHRQ